MDTITKQDKVDRLYMRMAFIWAENSYAVRRQVGCLIVKNNAIISDGYNGTPTGFRNVCEFFVNEEDNEQLKHYTDEECRSIIKEHFDCDHDSCKTHEHVLHAESNAISKLAKSNNSSDGATLYVTDEPCLNCSKMIIQAGIKRVVYSRAYTNHSGIGLLVQAGIKVKQIAV